MPLTISPALHLGFKRIGSYGYGGTHQRGSRVRWVSRSSRPAKVSKKDLASKIKIAPPQIKQTPKKNQKRNSRRTKIRIASLAGCNCNRRKGSVIHRHESLVLSLLGREHFTRGCGSWGLQNWLSCNYYQLFYLSKFIKSHCQE